MTPATHDIEAILFDMNGTLRQRAPDADWQRRTSARLLAMLGEPEAPASFLGELTRRYKSYTMWADEHKASLPEAEIWTRWMVPELPPGRIASQAVELMLVFRSCKGPHILKPGAAEMLAELYRRGYRLGVISNTTSTADLPRFIEKWGLGAYFEVIVLSAACGIRKPAPGIFHEATHRMDIDPARCAYLGNKVLCDVVGPRDAGFGMAMIITGDDAPKEHAQDPREKPDAVLYELTELLDLFPPRKS
jgi:HAD superfamily hydrolase (TIGR01549 family)